LDRSALNCGAIFFKERDRLHPGNLEALPATKILADHHVVATDHVRACFRKAGAIAIVGPRRQIPLFGADEPADLVFVALVTVGAVEVSDFLIGPFVEKLALFHILEDLSSSRPDLGIIAQMCNF